MRQNKQDRAKIAALVIVLVGLWVVIGVRYASLSQQWRAKEAARQQHSPAPAAPPGTPAEPSATSQPSSRIAALVTPVPPPERDPFRPVIAPRGHRRPGAATPPQTSALLPPPIPESPLTSGREALHVTGIVAGNPSVAVLRLGDQHYVLQEGDWLDDRTRVQAIGRSTVTLRAGTRTYTLRLGR